MTTHSSFIPPLLNMQRVGAGDHKTFVAAGLSIAKTLAGHIHEHQRSHSDLLNYNILDFGCGCGRVFIPLSEQLKSGNLHGCDVDASAIRFLQEALPEHAFAVNRFTPPLPYRRNFFDCIYSISIWTHLSPQDQLLWMAEIMNALRPGGIALISFSSFTALKARIKRRDPGWETVTSEALRARGVIFIPYPDKGKEQWRPGITSEYGLTLNCPDWNKATFSRFGNVLDVFPDAVHNCQDLLVLQKTE
jgi:SAM-dependent methyltransferase